MPLTPYQTEIANLLSKNRTEDSHLAGGAALHAHPDSLRYSEDLDYFHDSEERVASAFHKDREILEKNGFTCIIELNQPGYIRCLVQKKNQSTKVEWARDSSWRFMPVQKIEGIGYALHPIDLAINKLLALVGRDEARDFLDVLNIHNNLLPLGPLCWAACGKDPGLSPNLLLDLLKRRGKYRPEDFSRLNLSQKVDVQDLKRNWLAALQSADDFMKRAPAEDVGCLYLSKSQNKFIEPSFATGQTDYIRHYGRPGGILPVLI